MDIDSENEFFLASNSDVCTLESDEENKTQTNKNKNYLSVMEATKNIEIFDGTNKEPTVFTEACERAYRRINPHDIFHLNNVIRSKIQGNAREKLFYKELDLHQLLIEIKYIFAPAYQIDWMYELVNSKQEFYETPIMFGKRLEKIFSYATAACFRQFSPAFVQDPIDDIHRTSLRIFLEKLSNERLRKEILEHNPQSLRNAIEITESIWNILNYRFSIRLNENIYCPYCKDRDFHHYDCQIE